jgi:DMSO/TMAO reductase YedYZ molybdopterin-dependent catalytic subunit
VLDRAGLEPGAIDVMPQGLDSCFISDGVDLGRVRRPLPVAKALEDALLVYEMNGQPLTPDHGFPVRLVVPSWSGVASIKWLGHIQVSRAPLFSPWNTQLYRLFGADYPAEGMAITQCGVKSAFELAWNARVPACRTSVLHGRSWSGNGLVRSAEVSADRGQTWHHAQLVDHEPDVGAYRAWRPWEIPWEPAEAGNYTLRARATDVTGASQPDTHAHNTLGYLFGAVVDHPVTVA